jgi:hypothetical protein
MRRILLVVLVVLIVLVTITAGVAWYAVHDEAFLKSQLQALALKKTGRELRIDGPLRLGLGRKTTIEAEAVRFANAGWAEEPDMARIGRLRVVVDVPSLFGKTPIIELLAVDDCSLALVRREDGVANWVMLPPQADRPEPPTSTGMPVVLLDAEIRNCRLSHAAPGREQPLLVTVDEWSQLLHENQRWQLQGAGSIGGESVRIRGFLAPADALAIGGPVEHELEITVGEISLRSAGTIQDVATGQGADIDLRLHGPEIARIFSFLGLPPSSSGPFDFGLSLDTEGQLTRLNIDGDLGELRAHAQGELDRLVAPSQGRVQGRLEGPNLARLGRAFGLEGLAPTAYALDADIGFEPGRVRFSLFELAMPSDRLSVLGVLGTGEGLAGTDLDVTAHSDEPGRWAGAFGRPVRDIGAATLTGRLLSDANGQGTIRARVEHDGSTLTVDGQLGKLGEALQPDLNVDLHSDDPRALAGLFGDFALPAAALDVRGGIARRDGLLLLKKADISLGAHRARLDGRFNPAAPFSDTEIDLEVRSPNAAELGRMFGREGLPAAPFTLTGRVSRPGQRIRFEGVRLDLAGHHVRVDGLLNPGEKFVGSEFEVQLETPDVAALALLFGREGLPPEPMTLSGVLKPDGKGLQFKTEQGRLGDIRLAVDGRIPNLDQPLAVEGNFDIGLPSLTLLSFLAPEARLPDLPFSAVGELQNRQDVTQLRNVRLALGTITADISGELQSDRYFDLSIEAGGPDMKALQQWLGEALASQPFSLRIHAFGNPDAFQLADIDAQLGRSRAGGDLAIGLGAPKTISGKLASPYLDYSEWAASRKEARQPPESRPSSAFIFDDTDMMWVEDYGVAADVNLTVSELDLGNTRLRDIEVGFLLTPHRLELDPLTWRGERGGAVRGHAALDDSGAKPVLDIEMSGEDLRLGLSAGPDQDPATIPPVEMLLSLHGTGMTRREMASSLDGKVRAFGGPGLVASAGIDLFFSDFLSELFKTLNPVAETSDYTRLECLVWGADIVAGRVTMDPMVTHLEQFTIFSKGGVNLQTEKIDLSFNTKPRQGLGITPGTVINTLIKVGGTLKKPAIEIDPAGAIVGGTAAVATAGLSIVAKSFSDRFLSSKDPCGDARKELEKRDR